ncbi:oxidoreductase [Trueperella bernardiae]|uniref:oxidoreductase n=1 Tax=Trueperella bernardiae TaxID=59561 RepID=UPI002556D8A3|nr:oxidoreductase [Trueperella bernardiae]WIM08665.1 oxidoreductase [Trueperella bernardiae]
MLFSKKKGPLSQRRAKKVTVEHLTEFVATRQGIAAYFEAATSRDPSSIVLVASDGEWTRRKIPSIADAAEVARDLGIELYEVARTGYPREMREWSAKNRGR